MQDMKMKKPKIGKMDIASAAPGMGMPKFASRAMRPGGMAKGGKIHEDAAMDKKLIRKEIARAEKMEHKSEKKEMKKGGVVKKMAVGGMAPSVGSRRPGMQTMPAPAGGRPGASPNLGTAGGPGGGRPGMQTMPAPAGGGVRPMPGGGRPGMLTTAVPISSGGRPPGGGSMTLGTAGGPGGGRPGMQTMPAPVGGGVRTMPAPVGVAGVQTMPSVMKKGGAVGKMARGGGVERKGKTKGKFI
jgi:hypothetical protein